MDEPHLFSTKMLQCYDATLSVAMLIYIIRRENYSVHRRSKNCSVVSLVLLDRPLPSFMSLIPAITLACNRDCSSCAMLSVISLFIVIAIIVNARYISF